MVNQITEYGPIYSILKGYAIRMLNPNDLGIYMDFVRRHETFMGKQLTDEEKAADFKICENILFDPRSKTVGVFDPSGNLVTATSGYFYENFTHWYVYRGYQDTGDGSLNGAVKNYAMLLAAQLVMVEYAESINRFTYYNKFSVSHQIKWEKGYHLIKHKLGIIPRYDFLWEEIYMPGDTCRSMHHNFYFPPGRPVIDVPSIITICNLKQEIRREIISQKYGKDLGKDYLNS